MTTNDKEFKNKTKPDRPKGFIGIGAATGLGVLLLLGGTAVGFAASHTQGNGDRDDGLGTLSKRMGGNFASGEAPSGDIPSGMPGGMMGGTLGKVTSVSDTSITLTDNRSGGSVTFNLDSNTSVKNGSDAAKVSDIKVGDTVSVSGTSADDNELADSIVINPTSRF